MGDGLVSAARSRKDFVHSYRMKHSVVWWQFQHANTGSVVQNEPCSAILPWGLQSLSSSWLLHRLSRHKTVSMSADTLPVIQHITVSNVKILNYQLLLRSEHWQFNDSIELYWLQSIGRHLQVLHISHLLAFYFYFYFVSSLYLHISFLGFVGTLHNLPITYKSVPYVQNTSVVLSCKSLNI